MLLDAQQLADDDVPPVAAPPIVSPDRLRAEECCLRPRRGACRPAATGDAGKPVAKNYDRRELFFAARPLDTALTCIESACSAETTAVQTAWAGSSSTACSAAVSALRECATARLDTRSTALAARSVPHFAGAAAFSSITGIAAARS